MRVLCYSAALGRLLQGAVRPQRLILTAALVLGAAAVLRPAPLLAESRVSRSDIIYQPAPALPVVAVQFLTEERSEALLEQFTNAGYDPTAVLAGVQAVPRLYTTAFPADLREAGTSERKQIFIGALLPLVLMANEEIMTARRELERLIAKQAAGESLTPAESGWLADLAEYYESDPDELGELLIKVDAVPVALTLAQAIEESGWGTSRYAREGNALFGQRTWSQDVPSLTARKDGQAQAHRARAFADLMQSVRAYMHNLNSNTAFAKFREERAILRETGQGLDAAVLAGHLGRYAENKSYAVNLRKVIEHNELDGFEGARLATGTLAEGGAEDSDSGS